MGQPVPATLGSVQQELINQSVATQPYIRSALVTGAITGVPDQPQTLDWSMLGVMQRLMIRNKGPNSVWMSFDKSGGSVPPTVSNDSIEIQAQEAWIFERTLFQRVGLRCAASSGSANTATVHAVAWRGPAGRAGGTAI
jgi:cysteine synthase